MRLLISAGAATVLGMSSLAQAGSVYFNFQTDPRTSPTTVQTGTGQAPQFIYSRGSTNVTLTGQNGANVHYQDNLGIGVAGQTVSRIDSGEGMLLSFSQLVTLQSLSFIRDSSGETFQVSLAPTGDTTGPYTFAVNGPSANSGGTPTVATLLPVLNGQAFLLQNIGGGNGFTLAGATAAVPSPASVAGGLGLLCLIGVAKLRRRMA